MKRDSVPLQDALGEAFLTCPRRRSGCSPSALTSLRTSGCSPSICLVSNLNFYVFSGFGLPKSCLTPLNAYFVLCPAGAANNNGKCGWLLREMKRYCSLGKPGAAAGLGIPGLSPSFPSRKRLRSGEGDDFSLDGEAGCDY